MPVGIIVRSVSATAMVRWIDEAAFLNDALVKEQLEKYRATGPGWRKSSAAASLSAGLAPSSFPLGAETIEQWFFGRN